MNDGEEEQLPITTTVWSNSTGTASLVRYLLVANDDDDADEEGMAIIECGYIFRSCCCCFRLLLPPILLGPVNEWLFGPVSRLGGACCCCLYTAAGELFFFFFAYSSSRTIIEVDASEIAKEAGGGGPDA
jgi:hypothetical protein